MKKSALLFYYLIASKLPNYAFPGGRFFNAFRIFLLKSIIPIGNGNRIMSGVYIGSGKNISIGNNCRINENVRLDNVRIGNAVMIARESVVLGKMHEYADVSKSMVEQGNREVKQAEIGNDVWLGLRVIVLPEIKIAEGCIIGAGSVVTKDTEPFGVYAGVPAKLIRYRK